MCGSFFDALFEKRVTGGKYALLVLTVAIFCVTENMLGITWLNLLFMPIMYMLFSKIAYQTSLGSCIAYTLIFYVIFAGGREGVAEILYRFFSSAVGFPIPNWFTPGAIPFLILEYLIAFLFLLYIEKYMRKMKISGENGIGWYLLIMPITSLLIMANFGYMEFPSSRILQILMCVTTVLLYFSNAVIFIVLAKLIQVMNKEKQRELTDLKRDLEKRNFDRIESANRVYRKFLHDIHQYFSQFRSLAVQGKTQSIITIIDELEGKLRHEEEEKFYIGDSLINSLLVEYAACSKEKGIEVSVFAEAGLSVDFISDADKISLFGNLLSNAVEAAEKCEEKERKIDIKLYMGNSHMLIFRIENTHENKLAAKNGRLLSSKKDGNNHGLGIGIVSELAEKYGGSLEIEKMSGRFVTVLMVSNNEGEGKKTTV